MLCSRVVKRCFDNVFACQNCKSCIFVIVVINVLKEKNKQTHYQSNVLQHEKA